MHCRFGPRGQVCGYLNLEVDVNKGDKASKKDKKLLKAKFKGCVAGRP